MIKSENETADAIYAGSLNCLFYSPNINKPIDKIINIGSKIINPMPPPILLIKSGIPFITPI